MQAATAESGLISFDEPGMENFVVKKKNGTVIPLKEISAALGMSERKRYLAEFMAVPEGRLLLEDLRKDVAGEKKEEQKMKKEILISEGRNHHPTRGPTSAASRGSEPQDRGLLQLRP